MGIVIDNVWMYDSAARLAIVGPGLWGTPQA